MTVVVRDCWERYKTHHLPHTATGEQTLRYWPRLSWFADFVPDYINSETVAQYIETRRGVSNDTINRELQVLHAVLEYARRDGLIPITPYIMRLPKGAPRMRALNKSEVKKMIRAAEAHSDRADLFVKIALTTGARPGAICELRWTQIDMKAKTIDFRATGKMAHKRKKRVVVPIHRSVLHPLRRVSKVGQGLWVFFDTLPHPAKAPALSSVQRQYRRIVSDLANTAGVRDLTPHVFRHTVASSLLEGGATPLEVSRLLGHSNSRITETVYFQHSGGYLRNVQDKITLPS